MIIRIVSFIAIALLIVFLMGCASRPPVVIQPEEVVDTIPDWLLEPCKRTEMKRKTYDDQETAIVVLLLLDDYDRCQRKHNQLIQVLDETD